MDVIGFPYRPRFRAYFYLESGQDAVFQWLEREDVPGADRATLASLLDIYECNGLIGISEYIKDFGEGFYGLLVKRKQGAYPCPVFCRGPFDVEGEITLLTGGFWRNKILRPYYAIGVAKENLEVLRQNPKLRRQRNESTI